MKKCRKCGTIKEVGDFYLVKARKNKPHSWCKPCCTKHSGSYVKKNPGCWRNAFLINEYGISEQEYDALLKKQKGSCAICFEKTDKRLSVDHSHKTGTVRGLLCASCNFGLGNFKDDSERLVRASVYISSTRTLNGKS